MTVNRSVIYGPYDGEGPIPEREVVDAKDYDALVTALKDIAEMPDEENEWDGRDKYHECRQVAMIALKGSNR